MNTFAELLQDWPARECKHLFPRGVSAVLLRSEHEAETASVLVVGVVTRSGSVPAPPPPSLTVLEADRSKSANCSPQRALYALPFAFFRRSFAFIRRPRLFGCCGPWARGNITTSKWQYAGPTAGGSSPA